MKYAKYLFFISLLAAGCGNTGVTTAPRPVTAPSGPASSTSTPATKADVAMPISKAGERITKKFFGTYVTPKNSPVQPERFLGYHTGLDFEVYPDEQNTVVVVYAICEGKILRKGYASGYGGYAVQACKINGQAVTVVYGHLRQAGIIPAAGQILSAGKELGELGAGYSQETDGERKHLHMGIHLGNSVNIAGYVQNKNDLSGWLNPQTVLGL